MNQSSSTPVLPSTYYVYHSMATGFREGRVGQVDLAALRRRADVKNPWEPFDRLPPEAPHRWVSFYTLDIGYSLIVEAARLAFPTLPDNHLRALALQLVFDAAMVFFVCFIFAQWHVVLGLLTAYLTCLTVRSITSCRFRITTIGTSPSRSSCSARCFSPAGAPPRGARFAGAVPLRRARRG